MLNATGAAGFLRERGLLTEQALVRSGVEIHEASRRNRNFRIRYASGGGFLLKQGLGADRRRTLHREGEIYRYFNSAPDLAALRALIPAFVLFDPEAAVLVLELLDGSRTVAEELRQNRRASIRSGRAIGAAVGMLHKLTRPSRTPRGAPHGFAGRAARFLTLHRPTLAAYSGASAAALELIRIIQGSEPLCSALDRLNAEWREDALVHADLRFDHFHIDRQRRATRHPALTIVDWEMAGIGDAGWDVGSIFAEYLSAWLDSAPLTTQMSPADVFTLADLPLERMRGSVRAFWIAYLREVALPGGAAGELLSRATRFAAARLIQRAFEHAQHAESLPPAPIYQLQLSANILEQPEEAAAQLLGLLVSLA